MVASKMIVLNPVDPIYLPRLNPPLGGVWRNYDPVTDSFPLDLLSTIDACEVVESCVRLTADNQGNYKPLAQTVTGFLVSCVKSGTIDGDPINVMGPGMVWDPSGPWRLIEGTGTEYPIRTTLHAAYVFARLYELLPGGVLFEDEDLEYWTLLMLDSVRQMQKHMAARTQDQAWMAGSLSDAYVEASPNWVTNPEIRPLYIADMMWNAFAKAASLFGDSQTAGDGSGSYSLAGVRDDWFDWMEDMITNRGGLMSDTNPAYADLPYQIMFNRELIDDSMTYIGGVNVPAPASTLTFDFSSIDWEPGDMAFAFLCSDDIAAGPNQPPAPHIAPAGWIYRGGTWTGFGDDRGASLWAKTLEEGEDETPTFPLPAFSQGSLGIWRGLSPDLACASPTWAAPTNGGTTTWPSPPITATGPGLLIIGYFHRSSNVISTQPATFTQRLTGAWTGRSVAVADKPVTAGLQTPGNWVGSGAGLGSIQFSIVFAKPTQLLPEGRNILTRETEI